MTREREGCQVTDWAQLRAGRVVMADEAVLVISKPPGISVMGERHGTDLVRLAAAAGEQLFPVHRIDKPVSGAVLLARDLRWHGDLTRQFARRTAGRAYLAIVSAGGLPARGTIDLPLSTGRKNRVRVAAPRASIVASDAGDAGEAGGSGTAGSWSVPADAVFGHVRSYPSVTTFARLWQDDSRALLVVWPVSGRRHQIRVHLAWIGHPVEGDPLFGAAKTGAAKTGAAGRAGETDAGTGAAPRALLHSWRLSFGAAWRDGARLTAEAVPDPDYWAPLRGSLPAAGPEAWLAQARSLAGPDGTAASAAPG
jgi:tRNA pseudouridine32 synthase/23S rRNA pseudouridine746 synthase/23S rRNA pseudouridine1911/1915/1917 synthase